MAFTGTVVNYIEIKEDHLQWLPHVIWCILLWQSWVGFWWWVSAGMYAGEVADRETREHAKSKRRAKRAARRRRAQGTALPSAAYSRDADSAMVRWARRAGLKLSRHGDNADLPEDILAREQAATSPARRRRNSDSSLSRLTDSNHPHPSIVRRRRTSRIAEPDGIELQHMQNSTRGSGPRSTTHSSESDPSTHLGAFGRLVFNSALVRAIVQRLQSAHVRAAKTKALESAPVGDIQSAGLMGRFLASNMTPHGSALPPHANPNRPPSNFTRSNTMRSQTTASSHPGPSNLPIPSRAAHAEAHIGPSGLPLPSTAGEGMEARSWLWRGGVRKARLKAVDVFE